MNSNIYQITEQILLKEKEFCSQDNKLLKNKVMEAAQKGDERLISLLLENKETCQKFFKKVGNAFIFIKEDFCLVLQNTNAFSYGYTRYKQMIGFADANGNLIKNQKDVELVFPYKDAVLAGGQTKDDQKRKEVFYNELLQDKEITNLLAPKVLCNALAFDKENPEGKSVTEFNNENLIIRGNNLLALSSIKERYAGQVKCIYIDVPFNTGNDSFKYNDNFNHSTWMTFMKNRLELAKDLLSDDGNIFINVDYNEAAYLKVLCDEIFGRENLINEIIWRYRTYIGQVKKFFPRKHDNIFWYNKKNLEYFNQGNVGNFEDTPDFKRWKNFLTEDGCIVYGKHPTTDSRFTAYLNKYIKQYGEPKEGEIIYKNSGYVIDDVWEDIIALDAKNKTERIEEFSGSGQKPEALIERILSSVTQPGDLVLDFFLGSGTTAAVAHKMGRHYIGIEQMDYIKTITVERLKKVIAGEQGGISKAVDWNGGGSFVFCELAELNQKYADKIQSCKTEEEITALTEEIKNSDYISTHVIPSQINTQIQEYKDLSLEEKKQFAMEILDKNMLYINASDMEDKSFNVNDADKSFTKSFYSKLSK
ncbi:MAG: site-specific DNA-methyltransferase [Spirochaetales bacterium]|nr:site-specific DNA-methyltransferase [Spirochaetales bacterium]